MKEFTPGDKVFSSLGNESIYKIFGNMHDFLKKSMIELKYDDKVETIKNPYGYILNSLINLVNGSYNFFNEQMAKSVEEFQQPKIFYRISKQNEDSNFEYIESLDPNINSMQLDWSGQKDERDNTKRIYNYPPIQNNNVCISIGKNYVLIVNRFYEDEFKSIHIPANKSQLKHYFKFTTWVLHRKYVMECLRLINEYKKQNTNNDDNEPHFYPIPEDIKEDTLFNITSLKGNENTVEINNHLKLLSEYIKKYIISADPFKCKFHEPLLVVAPISDISSSMLHIHVLQEIITDISLKAINFKYELLKLNSSIYDKYTLHTFRIKTPLNNVQNNNNYLYNSKINNPYLSSLKAIVIFNLI